MLTLNGTCSDLAESSSTEENFQLEENNTRLWLPRYDSKGLAG
jgi:hypothetical protein